MSHLVLVASATAATAAQAIKTLSAAGTRVRAFVRKADDPRVAAFASLPGVEIFAGDLRNQVDVAKALKGATRALLVSSAFSFDHFEVESLFIEAAARAGLEITVRVSTASALIKPGVKNHYARAHHGLESFIEASKYKVVDLNSYYYFSNWFFNAAEAKHTGKVSQPVSGSGPRIKMVAPDDIGAAAAAILLQPSGAGLAPFLAKRRIEVQGLPANLDDVAAAISKNVGYEIKVQQVPRDAWTQALQDHAGVPRVFAQSMLETLELANGITPPGYEAYGPIGSAPEPSPELLALGWKPTTLEQWAASPEVKAVFAK